MDFVSAETANKRKMSLFLPNLRTMYSISCVIQVTEAWLCVAARKDLGHHAGFHGVYQSAVVHIGASVVQSKADP